MGDNLAGIEEDVVFDWAGAQRLAAELRSAASTHRARRSLITAWRRPRSSMCQRHTFLGAFLPGGASDRLDTPRAHGGDH